ncbi:single-stranded DNA-binding protein [Plantactinospora sp. B5E13]|uniref:single-stranded DNA-binding protein n=1 Tax=unclassified Plantactinospora TaxID=2631981 RepID=UPI00325F2226
MFDTNVTIVGNVLTAPEWRRTSQTGTLVANFKVASTARRLDRESGRWVDGNSLRVRVNCWRKLAEGVASSVMVGDPIIVVGRMYTRDWIDDAGNHRTMYELEAAAVGHDLSRGRGRFARNRPTAATSTLEDAEAQSRVHGEVAEPVPADEAPVLPDDRPFDDDRDYADGEFPDGADRGLSVTPGQFFGTVAGQDAGPGQGFGTVTISSGDINVDRHDLGDLDREPAVGVAATVDGFDGGEQDVAGFDGGEQDVAATVDELDGGGRDGHGPAGGEQDGPGPDGGGREPGGTDAGPQGGDAGVGGRGRRGRGRVPVPA